MAATVVDLKTRKVKTPDEPELTIEQRLAAAWEKARPAFVNR